MNGTIKKKTDRGFGFISQTGETNDLFFHGNDLVGITFDELEEGTEVTFDVETGQKGPNAKNVKVAEKTETEEQTEAKEQTE